MEEVFKDTMIKELQLVVKTLIEDSGLYFTDEDMTTFSVLKYDVEIERLNDVIDMIKEYC